MTMGTATDSKMNGCVSPVSSDQSEPITDLWAAIRSTLRPHGPSVHLARRARPSGDRYPLSHAQDRLWSVQQLEPTTAYYNVSLAWWIHGALDVTLLTQAINAVLDRHASLRTVFGSEGKRPYARVLTNVNLLLALSASRPAHFCAQHSTGPLTTSGSSSGSCIRLSLTVSRCAW
jgi:hypothetical protein